MAAGKAERSAQPPAEPAPPADRAAARPPLARELLLIAGFYLVYRVGRRLANGEVADAFRNARDVWHLERVWHLPDEARVQDLLVHGDTGAHLVNAYYAAVHFPATLAFLVWLYWRRPLHYTWARTVMAWLTAGGLALHLAYPLAPPRMLPEAGMTDTAAHYGPAVYDRPETDTLANQFAAMPSLHVGWAALVALGLILAGRTRWRWLWPLHPLATLLVVVATANHYWLDGVVALALLGAALLLVRRPAAIRRATPAAG
jgi:hypothetical protein